MLKHLSVYTVSIPNKLVVVRQPILGLQPRDKAAMLGGQYN